MLFQRIVAAVLAGAMVLPAQQTASSAKAEPGSLKIIVIEGEGAKNNIRSNTAVAPVVEVRDDAEKPVAGAEVVFQLPASGASGNFNGWLKTQTVRTDGNGRAAATGYTPNDQEGRMNIKVVASSGTKSTSLVIAQSNIRGTASAAEGSPSRNGWWKWAAVIGGGAIVGGVVAATRNGDSSATAVTTRPISINPGAITVGGPR